MGAELSAHCKPNCSDTVEETVVHENSWTRTVEQEAASAWGTGGSLVSANQLNVIFQLWWPYISEYVMTTIYEQVEPVLVRTLPAMLKGLHFDRKKCTLGDTPPFMANVTMEKRWTTDGRTTNRYENMVILCDTVWDGHCKITMGIHGTSLGVTRIYLRGTMIIEVVHMQSEMPMSVGVRGGFLDPPSVKFQFSGASKVLNHAAFLKRKVHEAFIKTLSSMVVMPHMKGMSLKRGHDIFSLTHPFPEGVLRVTVWECKDLLAVDSHWFSKDSSDPYAEISLGDQKFNSSTVIKNTSPKFGDKGKGWTVALVVHSVEYTHVFLKIWDEWNSVSEGWESDLLGETMLEGKEATQWKGVQWRDLANAEGSVGSNGKVSFSTEWHPLVEEEPERRETTTPRSDMAARTASYIFVALYGIEVRAPPQEDPELVRYWVTVSVSHVSGEHPVDTRSTARTMPRRLSSEESASSEEARLQAEFARKEELLQGYGVSAEDINDVLGRDPRRKLKRSVGSLNQDYELMAVTFNAGFEFLLVNYLDAEVSFSIMRKAPTDKQTVEIDRYKFPVLDIMGNSSTQLETAQEVECETGHVSLKHRLFLRFVGDSK